MTRIQSSVIRDTIEIYNGADCVKKIPYTVNVTKAANEVQAARAELAAAAADKDLEAIGKVMARLFSILFGEAAGAELLEYYDEDYTTMIADISPVVVDTIFPAFDRQRQRMVDAKKKAKAR